ncbi:hypothetical protein [Roseateles sp.]|uniref:hypothetical protein n=1 Tax=Roseateles sp. TaxID=1971397 RepID=UPI0031CF08A5
MPTLKKSDLKYSDYSWTAVPGDDPTKTADDADRFSRKEGYEVLTLINSLTAKNGADLDLRVRQICEWMIHEQLPSNIQGRSKVKAWIFENYPLLSKRYPF